MPGRIDRAGEAQAGEAAGADALRVLERRQHRPVGVEAQADAQRRAEQPPAGRALEPDEPAVDEPEAEPEAAAQPGVAIALGRQRQPRLALVVLARRRRGRRRGAGGVAGAARAARTIATAANAGVDAASASNSAAAGVHRSCATRARRVTVSTATRRAGWR